MLTTFLAAVGLGLAVAAPVGPTGTTAIRQGLSGGWRRETAGAWPPSFR